jgi:nicotinamide-nucleotide amidase
LAVAESLTCGGVQARIGAISGASNFFLGGVTAYTLDEKVKLLGVDRRGARRVNCVSEAVALAMAAGVCRLFGSDVGVATTGYAEPDPAQGVPEPMAWWAIVRRGPRGRVLGQWTGRVECPGATRTDAQAFVAEAVLAALLEVLPRDRAAAG